MHINWHKGFLGKQIKNNLKVLGAPQLSAKIGDSTPGSKQRGEEAQDSASMHRVKTGELGELERDYQNIPNSLRDKYTAAAQAAGTYGNTDQFKTGLDSEVQAGTRGARLENIGRQNAIRQYLGMNPLEGEATNTGTMGNATQQALQPGGSLPNPDPTGPIAPAAASPQMVNPLLTQSNDRNNAVYGAQSTQRKAAIGRMV